MAHVNFESLQTDELWAIHEQIGYLLARKLQAEKSVIEARLVELRRRSNLHPKFQNPDEPSQTWSGRGRPPKWVSSLLATGKTMEDLRILS
ncbi:H-NS family nucleoid-associated regulatory protein [Bradyrhizobium sp. CB3481]|uniref:H-NS histone family protein n=1 Tax=Bradyrhizobium sp. CB3481 TaxID=3039158 RepID=UPI0024B131F1|nr:H-NS family nucleoid-associated regulatory protein [Bradyrhizobium sp. CB3481]WFU18736.1 H-NS family nucleoid-associated regulatory protein [Bradyrhizobium sp. CB3481]